MAQAVKVSSLSTANEKFSEIRKCVWGLIRDSGAQPYRTVRGEEEMDGPVLTFRHWCASFIACTDGSSSHRNWIHGKYEACGAQLHLCCVGIRNPPVDYRHLAEDQKDAEPTIEDEPAHYAPSMRGWLPSARPQSRQMMTRKVLRCVAPAPSRICDRGLDSPAHGGALKYVRDRHAELHACEMVQRVRARALKSGQQTG